MGEAEPRFRHKTPESKCVFPQGAHWKSISEQGNANLASNACTDILPQQSAVHAAGAPTRSYRCYVLGRYRDPSIDYLCRLCRKLAWSVEGLVGSLSAKKQQFTTMVMTITRSNHLLDTSRYATSSNRKLDM